MAYSANPLTYKWCQQHSRENPLRGEITEGEKPRSEQTKGGTDLGGKRSADDELTDNAAHKMSFCTQKNRPLYAK